MIFFRSCLFLVSWESSCLKNCKHISIAIVFPLSIITVHQQYSLFIEELNRLSKQGVTAVTLSHGSLLIVYITSFLTFWPFSFPYAVSEGANFGQLLGEPIWAVISSFVKGDCSQVKNYRIPQRSIPYHTESLLWAHTHTNPWTLRNLEI